MTIMMQKMLSAGLKVSEPVKRDVQRAEASIQKPKWMQKADKKFNN